MSAFRRTLGRGDHARHDLTAVAAVEAEVCVGGQDDGIGEYLRHPYQLGVGQTGRHLGVLLDQLQDVLEVVAEIEADDKCLAPQQFTERPLVPATEQVKRFGERRLAGLPRRRQPLRVRDGPPVMRVAAAQQRDEEAGVNEDACGHIPIASGSPCASR